MVQAVRPDITMGIGKRSWDAVDEAVVTIFSRPEGSRLGSGRFLDGWGMALGPRGLHIHECFCILIPPLEIASRHSLRVCGVEG